MDFSSNNYLPNSDRRISYLQEIVDGRTVAILAAGASIEELENRIYEIRNCDICYFGFNSFLQEENIIQRIDRHYSVYMDSCKLNIPHTINDIIKFLDRDEDNLFISSFYNDTFELMDSNFDLNQFLKRYDRKITLFSLSNEKTFPNYNQPLHFILSNSLLVLIQMAIIGKASRIMLFGADGGYIRDTEKTYYRHGEPDDPEIYKELYLSSPIEDVVKDTNMFFNPIADIGISNIYKTYFLPKIDIINCSKYSLYTPFPKVSYDVALDCLKANPEKKL